MRKFFTSLSGFVLAFFLFLGNVHAQQDIAVKGKVTDAGNGEPLIGVSIKVKGTSQGTSSDVNGDFTIKAPANGILVFSYIGFQNTEIPVNGQASLSVKLSGSAQNLQEVVVVGYGTQRRSQIVGSVSSVKSEEITKQPVLTAAQGLQGKASGVQISASGQPGSQPQVRIRGVGSITGNQNPIYVVDGVITDDITNINNTDIASIEVLKDASAQAIYGSRAGNGVILVTTKSGKAGKMQVGLNSYTGFRSMTNKVDMADARSYAIYSNEAITRSTPAGEAPKLLFDPNNLPTQTTDWMDAVTRQGVVQNYDFNINGGSEKTTYYFSAGYFGDQGILKGSKYERFNARLNNEYRIAPVFSFGHNLTVSYGKSDNIPASVFASAYRMSPAASIKNPDGSYGYQSGLNVGNPVATIDYTNDFTNSLRLQGNGYVTLKPVSGLTIRSDFNFDKTDGDGLQYQPVYTVFSAQQNETSRLTLLDNRRFYYIWSTQGTYSKTFSEKHEVNITAGYSFERDRSQRSSVQVQDVPNQRNLWYLSQGNINRAVIDPNNNTGDLVRRQSLFGRATYTFDKRYNLSGSLRRDGSSSFPVNNKWGTFYSIGGSWNVSEESFMKDQKIFDYLRLRVGYGKVGNDISIAGNNLAALRSVAQVGYVGFDHPKSAPVLGISYDQNRDANVSWETTKGVDAAVEFGIISGKLRGSAGYYNKLTNAFVPVIIPALFGDKDNTVYFQAADVRNRGAEFALNWEDRANGNFTYRIGGNVTFNKNVVDKVAGNLRLSGGSLSNGEIATLTVVGQPVGSFWVYQVNGFDNAGNFIYADTNGDGVVTEDDRIFAGSYQPKAYFGFNAGFDYKKWDFAFDLYGNLGNKIFNGKRAVRFGNDAVEKEVFEGRWTPENSSGATSPAAFNAIPKPSTYYVESGNFLRVNNITLGYTFDQQKIPFLKDGRLRVFATAQNPFIFKSYSGFSPEIGGSTSGNISDAAKRSAGSATNSGIELDVYPVYSTYMFGLNFTF